MTPGEIVTTVLSSLAFVMSVVSLGWQVARARANRPRLHVEGSVGCTVMEDDYSKATWSFDITVANLGSEAITVDDARWIIYSTDGGIRVKETGAGPTFPLRLEGKDSRTWTYEIPVRGTRWHGLVAKPSADFVSRPSRWRRKQQSVRQILVGQPQEMCIPPAWKERIEATHGRTIEPAVSDDAN